VADGEAGRDAMRCSPAGGWQALIVESGDDGVPVRAIGVPPLMLGAVSTWR
jgi:hypothetical protein